MNLAAVSQEVEKRRAEGLRIVQCHGVFDLLHPGHLHHLAEAKSQGDVLVVSVTADRYVNKGPGRPLFTQAHRAALLAALDLVDFVVLSEEQTAIEAIKALRPDVFVKGPDYVDPSQDVSGNISLEQEAVVAVGGTIYFTQGPTMSSSSLINAYLSQSESSQSQWLESFRSKYSERDVIGWMERVRNLRVLVIGEAIIDEYVRCSALGKSSKDPVLAFREAERERQLGGSLAIASHCAGLGAKVTALFRIGCNPDDEEYIRQGLDPEITPEIVISQDEPTIIKRRYVDSLTEARVFETYVLHDGTTSQEDDLALRKKLRHLQEASDLVIVADYGHGLISAGIVEDLTSSSSMLAVNTQSNAGNRGFNTISRYPRVDFVCLNGGEVELELRRRDLTISELVPQLRSRTGAQRAIVTQGAMGLACCGEDGSVTQVPAFAEVVRDRVGAGDALFAATALLSSVEAPLDVTGFFGNLAGAASVATLGNEARISASDLVRHASTLLK